MANRPKNEKYEGYNGTTPLPELKQEEFCNYYIETFDRYESVKSAGYTGTKNSMSVLACRLLKDINIQKRIEYLQRLKIEDTKKKWNRTALDVLSDINLIKERCMGNVLDGNLKPYKIDHKTAIKCLELEGKYLGMWEKENTADYPEITIGGEDELED